ncbi:hypothetical protein N7495_001308 [Penicillium taxi]|uniref:uncharacterized protein n=1 Tax=Penicillium taxi TaxID=168475 RepID=UPI0025451201|nr:uncharacterized protein N7495_001308 [Penicillium taxi]KAJ5908626.1 hypothetical protein N7495_001308 [Penicillium taxi]
MSERKVLTKYYPPDFDPSAISRKPKGIKKKGPKVITVRLMAPFPMKCTACGEYIHRGRKFNARKETLDEKYLSIAIIRFYIRCTRCSGEITFRTDPKNMDYECERGAKRNFESWRDSKDEKYGETQEETLERLERAENEEEEKLERDKMAELEEKMKDSKREMAIADALDEIRTRNARIQRNGSNIDEAASVLVRDEVDESRLREEKEDEEAARLAFRDASGVRVKRLVEEEDAILMPPPPPPIVPFKRGKKKSSVPSLGIKKKPSLI